MRILTLFAVSALSLAVAVPAIAQDAMSKDAMGKDDMAMKMTPAEMKMEKKCGAMSHEKMMKNAGCMKMAKMHPAMANGDSMMAGH